MPIRLQPAPNFLAVIESTARAEPDAEFAILVPATRVAHQLTWVEGEAKAVAEETAERAEEEFERRGAKVVRTAVGDESPLLAIADELRDFPTEYKAIMVSTFAPGISRWLGLDLPHRVERQFGLPVRHVVAQRREVAARAEA